MGYSRTREIQVCACDNDLHYTHFTNVYPIPCPLMLIDNCFAVEDLGTLACGSQTLEGDCFHGWQILKIQP